MLKMSLILEKISLLPICDFYLNLLVFHSLDYPTFLVSPLLFILAPTTWVARSTFGDLIPCQNLPGI